MSGRIKSAYPNGYDALAKALVKTPGFPPGEVPQKIRSLGNRLRDLDKGATAATQWLEARREVRACLLKVLDWREADLQRVLHPGPEPAFETLVELEDVQLVRPLDLRKYPLFPGIPQMALSPDRWRRHWWFAPAGSGRTLSGRWLDARGAATFLRPRTAEELAEALPSSGSVYIDLERADPGTIRSLYRLPDTLRVLIAAPYGSPDGWAMFGSDPAAAWGADLMRWVGQWIDGHGAFDASAAIALLRKKPWRSLFATPGDALALAGLIDELGAEGVSSAPPGKLVGIWLAGAVSRQDRADAPAWVRDDCWSVLQVLARSLVTRAEGPWSAPRALESWAGHLAAPGTTAPDVGGALDLLSTADEGMSALDVRRLRGQLESTGAGRAQGLVAARLLEPADGGRYQFRPRWALHLACRSVTDDLLAEGPRSWGAAALRTPWAKQVVSHVWERCRRGDRQLISEAAESLDLADPVTVGAVEAAFCATGLACAEGVAIEKGVLKSVWRAQVATAVQPYRNSDHHRPRIAHGDWDVRDQLMSEGVWILAATAIAEQLEPPLAKALGDRLAPWHAPMEASQVADEITRIPLPSQYVGQAPDDPAEFDWAPAAYALGARLLQRCGPIHRGDEIIDIQAPAYLVSQAEAGEDLTTALRFIRLTIGAYDAIRAAADQLSVEFDVVCRALWEADAEQGSDGEFSGMLIDGRHPDASRWWSHAPAHLLAGPLAGLFQLRPAPWEWLDESQRRAVVDALLLSPRSFEVVGRLVRMPDDALAYAIENCRDDQIRDQKLLETAWYRLPHISLQEAVRRLRADDVGGAVRLLRRAPDGEPVPGLDALEEWASKSPKTQDSAAVRRYLHQHIGSRSPGWLRAYALFTRLEQAS